MGDLARILSPCLWLLCELPAAETYLGTSSANEGDTVSIRCLIPTQTSATIVYFCKDGMEISKLKARRGKFSYNLAYIVAGSSGHITCGYMYKNDNNQVFSSLQSIPRYLKVTGADTTSSMTINPHQGLEKDTVLSATIPALFGLILAFILPLVYYLKKKKVVTKRRRERLQSLRERKNRVTEDQYGDSNLGGYSYSLGREDPDLIYQNIDPEKVPPSTGHLKQKYDSGFPLYVNDPRRP